MKGYRLSPKQARKFRVLEKAACLPPLVVEIMSHLVPRLPGRPVVHVPRDLYRLSRGTNVFQN